MSTMEREISATAMCSAAVAQSTSLTLPANVHEGDGVDTGTLTVFPAPSGNLQVTLASSDSTRISVPTTVTVLAGQTSATVPLTIIDDGLLDGPEAVTISAAATGYLPSSTLVEVHDYHTAVLSVSLPATAVKGGAPLTGTITSSAAPAQEYHRLAGIK